MKVYSQRSLLQPRDCYFCEYLIMQFLQGFFRDLFATMLGVPLPDCFWCGFQVMNRSNKLWISPVSLCVIHNGLGPGSEVGGKRGKSASEASERVWGGIKMKELGCLPPSPVHYSACLACRFFAVSSRFCLFPPLRSLVPTELMLYNFFTIKINLEVQETQKWKV